MKLNHGGDRNMKPGSKVQTVSVIPEITDTGKRLVSLECIAPNGSMGVLSFRTDLNAEDLNLELLQGATIQAIEENYKTGECKFFFQPDNLIYPDFDNRVCIACQM